MTEQACDITIRVDGTEVAARVAPRHLLCDFLRATPSARGVHVACGHGVCGACSVVVDGVVVRSCLMLAVQADGCAIETIASETTLTRLQQAFREHHAVQCGYCTPGLLIATARFLQQYRAPSRAQILDHLNGHLCRCSGYANIVAAIESVAQ